MGGRDSFRVLCYSPYNLWTLHGLWEMTLLHGARLRGADLRYVLCDGLYTDCDVFWAATAPRHERACTQCQAHVAGLVHQMGLPFEWLGRYVLPADLREAERFARTLGREELLCARYGEWNVGAWVRSSVCSDLRMSELDPSLPEVERALRSYVQSGLVACFGLSRLLDDYRPNVLLVFNGRMSSTRVALELARVRGIRVVCHERGNVDESLSLWEDCHALSLEPVRRVWSEWGAIPLETEELERVEALLRDRREGRNLNWRAFSPPPDGALPLRERLGLAPGRRLWVLFTSSDDEVVAEWGSPFAAQREWLEETVRWCGWRRDLDLVVRAHPNTGSRLSTGTNRRQLDELHDLAARAPSNVRVVLPDAPLSSYALMDLASAGLVYQSTCALEMAALGKPVLVGASSWFSGVPFVRTVREAGSYEDDLEKLTAAPLDALDPNVRRLAYRFAFAYFLRQSLPFPLVEMPDPHTGRLRYRSLEDLAPGRDAGLDRAMRVLLDGEPLVPAPGPEERAGSEEAETAFFEREKPV